MRSASAQGDKSSFNKIDAASSSDDANSSDNAELDEYGDLIRKYKSLCYEDLPLGPEALACALPSLWPKETAGLDCRLYPV
jgi:hypothetical protein